MSTVLENIKNEIYVNKIPYPNSNYSSKNIINTIIEESGFKGSPSELEQEYIRVQKEQKEKYIKERDLYHQGINDCTNRFRNDLEEELGIVNNIKKDILWNIAYDHGHSEGMQGVYNWMNELVDLIL